MLIANYDAVPYLVASMFMCIINFIIIVRQHNDFQ